VRIPPYLGDERDADEPGGAHHTGGELEPGGDERAHRR
jgi:hypothetical protein